MESEKGINPPYNPLKAEKTDHPELVGGIVWTDCELKWIRAYGTRCYNHGHAKGLEDGKLLCDQKVSDYDEQRERLQELRRWYSELLHAVERKFPGESRHETALRYIRAAEESPAYETAQYEYT